jgi:hypothetical protein
MSRTARLKRRILKLKYKIEIKNNTINQLTDEIYTLNRRTEVLKIDYSEMYNCQKKIIEDLIEISAM